MTVVTVVESEFKNLGHKIASLGQRFTAWVKNDADTAIAKLESDKETVESIVAVLGPQAELITRAAFAALGVIGQDLDDTASAVAKNLLDKNLDTVVKNDILAAIQLLKQKL